VGKVFFVNMMFKNIVLGVGKVFVVNMMFRNVLMNLILAFVFFSICTVNKKLMMQSKVLMALLLKGTECEWRYVDN
jgi:hypothetical protein